MPNPLLKAALSAIGPMLAKKGLDQLGGVFRGTYDKDTEDLADLIKEKTGIDIVDAAEDKLTEEQWVKLKEFETENQEHLLSYLQSADAQQISPAKTEKKDLTAARAMQQSALASDDRVARQFIYWYAVLITVLTFSFIFLAAFFHPGANSHASRIIDTVLGFLLGVSLSAIIQFFFGSSEGSSKKQQQIERLAQQVSGGAPPTGGQERGTV